MSTDSLDRFERLFLAARMHAPDERAAFLDAACADDPVLRYEIEELLVADAEADSDAFLDAPLTGSRALEAGLGPAAHDDEMQGRHLGPFVIQRRLGRGGMGEVYLALREEPFKQYVALKLIKRGMDTREVIARFAVERQILASLNHPHIARLIDGGVTDEGLPYLAMEYVEGRPLTTYCDERRLSIRERLQLFLTVCQAVQYAHQNLVIHRDLKPSNILVTGNGTVKLLDFGIAKLLNPHLSPVDAPMTRTELRLMTPEYASPEQLRGEPLTTATDVYALGVILYELLTGQQPHQIRGLPTQEVLSIVCEQEVPRPSTRIWHTTKRREGGREVVVTPEAVGAARQATPERLLRQVRGDLDNIALMALRPEAGRRYGSAELLAQDIARHLGGMPVAARPNTVGYRVRKFAARHRVSVLAALVVAVALVGGLGAALWQARVAQQERDRAQHEAEKAAEVSQFLLGLFARADPTAAPGDTVRVRDVLEQGAAHVEADLREQPLLQAELLSVIGQAYDNLGRTDRAVSLLERAVVLRQQSGVPPDAAAAQGLYDLADAYARQSDFEQAERLFRAYIEQVEALQGPRHVEVLRGSYRLWGVLHQRGERMAADSLFGTLLAMEHSLPAADDSARSFVITELAYALAAMQRYAEAEAYYRTALAMETRMNGGQHPRVAFLKSRMAGILNLQGRHAEAAPFAREAVALNAMLFPAGHEQAASGLYHLGRTLEGMGAYEAAARAMEEAVTMLRALYGTRHRSLPQYTQALARLHTDQGYFARAEPHYQALIDVCRAQFGASSECVLSAQADLGDNLRRQRRYAEAEALLRPAYAALRDRVGTAHRRTRQAAAQLADLYQDRGRPAAADSFRAQAALPPERP